MSEYEQTDFDQGDVCYALKRHNPAENKHQRGCSPAEVKELAFASLRLQKIMEEVAVETSRDLKDIHADVQALLEEMGHKMMMPAVRTLAMGLRRVFRTVLQAVHVNREGIEEMKRAIERWPVVLLPSHRSYFDFILVSYIMFEYNIKLPCIAAGQDFMNMSMVSSFLRRSGAFFLRRTFSSDRLYKAVFTEYVQTLLCSCDHPLEFFIEGTRSRTAKSLHPRLGLLSMVVEPYLDGRIPDIFLVPVSISYQRTLEEELFARELLGIPKPKESTKGLFKARSILSQDYGNIFVHISPPISLHDVCLAKGISRIPHSLFPKAVSVVLPSERELVLELGHMILDHTHHGMRLFPSSMVAALLLQHRDGIALSDLVERVESLKEEIVQKGGKIYWEGDTSRAIHSSIDMLSTALELTGDNILKLRTGHLHSKLSVPRRRPPTIQEVIKMNLDDSDYDVIADIGSVHLLLAHYRNQLVHLFVPEAMAALCLHSDVPCDRDTALRRYEALHCALAREFVLPLKNTNELFSESLRALVDRGLVLLLDGEITVNGQKEETVSFLGNLVLPFVAGVWVVCHHLISFAGGVQSLTATIKGAQLLAAKCIQTGLLETFDILSLEMVRNALASLTQAALILQPSSEVEGRGRLVKVADQEKLVQLAEELGSLLPIGCGVTPTAKL